MNDFEVNTCPINKYYILAEMIIAIRWVHFYLYRFSNYMMSNLKLLEPFSNPAPKLQEILQVIFCKGCAVWLPTESSMQISNGRNKTKMQKGGALQRKSDDNQEPW